MPLNRSKSMTRKIIHSKPDYILEAEIVDAPPGLALNLYTIWPQARTDRSQHRILNINLPTEGMSALGDFIKQSVAARGGDNHG
jgi:hypothetical protein